MIRFPRRPAVSARYGLPVSTMYDWIAKRRLLKTVRLGNRSVGWSVAELEAWERERIQERDARATPRS